MSKDNFLKIAIIAIVFYMWKQKSAEIKTPAAKKTVSASGGQAGL